ncbi:hypothetical protein [Legionella maceachernii]|uniref:Purine NTPase n=1 Tax=Legionella maceachernii TaxID=466 RepID=A0A0W0WAK5_9GAMM|nr:hypothetical protein [Legionella maceachernii]KTD29388.1 purine NTPase [Legionella maceachernii]SJZ95845.1 hypothetical protein SAMN02745128_01602 [Legionella maceachernii]SUP03237.1 Uncharacterised protein [Legionella maceachernii]
MKQTKYTKIFNVWRNKSAAAESNQLKTAIAISEYIDHTSLEDIKADLLDSDSPQFEEFNKHSKRSMGTLAFARLAIFDYLENLSATNEENQVIRMVLQSIESLYEDPYHNTKENIEQLIDAFKRWLKECVDKNPNKTQVKEACKSIYTVLKIIDITMGSIPRWIKLAARTAGINVNALHEKVKKLISTTEERIKLLERQVALRNLSANTDSSSPQSLIDYIALIDWKIVNNLAIPLSERIEALLQRTQSIPSDLMFLQEAFDLEQLLSKQKTNAEALLLALKENNQQVTGRLYILDFITKNRKKFDELITSSDDTKDKRELLEKLEEIAHPSLYRKAVSSIQYTSSTMMFLPTSLLRYASPKLTQSVSNYLPDTLDSAAKINLENVIKTYLEKKSSELETVRKRIKDRSEKIAQGDKALEQLLLNCELIELANAAKALSDSKENKIQALVQFQELWRLVENGKRALVLTEEYDSEIDALIEKHDGFMVKLSNFLANFFFFFKSETAQTIDNAVGLKKNIKQLRAEYAQVIHEAQQKIIESTAIPEKIKISVIDQFTLPVKTTSTSKVAEKLEYLSAKDHYELIKRGFFCLKPIPISSVKAGPQTKTEDILLHQTAPAV